MILNDPEVFNFGTFSSVEVSEVKDLEATAQPLQNKTVDEITFLGICTQ